MTPLLSDPLSRMAAVQVIAHLLVIAAWAVFAALTPDRHAR